VFAPPFQGHVYVIGIDPAEGNPTSDDSALEVLDADTGEEVACLAGKFPPQVLASYAHQIGTWYNHALLMCERNNHGHAVLGWLAEHSHLQRLMGQDQKPGWLSSTLGKTALYDPRRDSSCYPGRATVEVCDRRGFVGNGDRRRAAHTQVHAGHNAP
jgi:hypothetical protein